MLSAGKLKRMRALANEAGAIAALAMDQRGALRKMLGKHLEAGRITAERMAEFKSAVTRILSPHATAVLLDPEYGLEAARGRGPNCGLLLSYEKSGYDNTQPGRLPDLLDHVSVKRIAEDWQADAVKLLVYYTPFEDAGINDVKHALVERIGAECETHQIPFFLEFVGYDPAGGDEKGLEYASKKPEIVTRSMEEFSRPQYRADVLKVEIPVNIEFIGQAYSREQALGHFRRAAAAATKPFIYLSAGVTNAQFVEALGLAAEAGSDFSGVLCGRATWQDGVAVYARHGLAALEDWLATDGVRNISAVNQAIRGARPWWVKMR